MINLSERLKQIQIENDELERLLEMIIENILTWGTPYAYTDLTEQLRKVFPKYKEKTQGKRTDLIRQSET